MALTGVDVLDYLNLIGKLPELLGINTHPFVAGDKGQILPC